MNRISVLLVASFIAAFLQIPFLFIGSSAVGTVVYKLMVLSLNLVDQPLIPTLKFSIEGWPIPTVVGYVVYTIFSAGIIFLLVWSLTPAFVRSSR